MEDKPASPDDRQAPGVSTVPNASLPAEQEFGLLMHHMIEAFCEVEMSGRIIRWNQAFLQLTGYAAEEIGSLTYVDLTPEKWHAFEEGIVRQQVLPRGHSHVYEKEYRRKDGSIVPIELRTCLTLHPDGSPKSMWAIIRDISERKRSEDFLLDAARRWQATFDAVSVSIAVLDLQQRVVLCNRATAAYLNLPLEQILGSQCYELFHASSSPIPECPYCTMRETGLCAESAVQVGERWFEVRVDPLKNRSGELAGGIHVMYDITERKRSEHAIKNAAAEWRTTFDAVGSGICLLDRDMRIVRANRAMADIAGRPIEELPGQFCWKIVHGSDRPIPDCICSRLLISNKADAAEMQIGDRWFHVSLDPLLDEAGELCGAVHVMRDVTERRGLLDQLSKSEALLSDTERLAHIGSFQVDADTGGIFWSDELYRIFEIPEHMPPLNFEEICSMAHPADAGKLRRTVEALFFAGAGIVDEDFRVVLRSGGQKHLHLIGQTIRSKQGQGSVISGAVKDVTMEIQAEDALYRDEERLALLLEMTNMRNTSEQELFEWALEAVVFLAGSTGGYFHLYDEDLETTTLTAWSAEVKEQCKTPASLHHPLSGAGIWADSIRRRDAVVHNDYASGSGERVLPKGHFPLKRHLGVPVFDGGRIVAVAGVSNKEEPYDEADVRQVQFFMNDMWTIVARTRAEKRLSESEHAFRSLFEASLDGVFRIGADGRIERANLSLARICGLEKPDELFGRFIMDFWENPFERSVYLALLREKGQVRHYPFRLRTAAGKLREVEVTATVLRNERGEFIAEDGILCDVTEQRQLQEQLRRSQKMEAVGRLAGGIAHDFNNILSAMLGFASLPLMSGKVGDSERNTLQQIISLVERAATLTKGLLAFSRRQILTMKPEELNRIVGIVVNLLRRLIGADISLIVRESPLPLPLQADAGQIEQVFMNLATNARDAMPDGGTLTIEAGKVSLAGGEIEGLEPGDYALIRVSDTGAGIAPADLDKIFDPFFTTKETGKGTGLGLASVYGIMQQHGGTVRVQSTVGTGTTFLLYLPLSAAAGEASGESDAAPVAGGSETILLAEDDTTLRRITKKTLEMRGYAVLEAENGAEAVAICEAEKGKIDLILTDVVMPELGGLEAWHIMHERYPAIRIVFMSGYISDEGKRAAIERLGHTCLTKPFEPRQLFAIIRKELDRA
ncbi:MAG TPA: PAS domain S-box protein [Dissulfurispiraceae bacterium]|nr:PAS domain S-box protein [Dissulfurispiraceae bacterium]